MLFESTQDYKDIKTLLMDGNYKWALKKSRTPGLLTVCFLDEQQEMKMIQYGFVKKSWRPIKAADVEKLKANLVNFGEDDLTESLRDMLHKEFKSRQLNYTDKQLLTPDDGQENLCTLSSGKKHLSAARNKSQPYPVKPNEFEKACSFTGLYMMWGKYYQEKDKKGYTNSQQSDSEKDELLPEIVETPPAPPPSPA